MKIMTSCVLHLNTFSTNGVATKGMFGMPTIGYGPGREEHAHTRDDQVRADELVEAAEFYTAFALKQVDTKPRATDGFGPTGT